MYNNSKQVKAISDRFTISDEAIVEEFKNHFSNGVLSAAAKGEHDLCYVTAHNIAPIKPEIEKLKALGYKVTTRSVAQYTHIEVSWK